MKKFYSIRNKFLMFLLTFLIAMGGFNAQVSAGDKSSKKDDFSFSETISLKDNELDDVRGKFIARNGMVIDFSFSANTLVDGSLINQIALDSGRLTSGADSLHNIIQIGEGNTAFSGSINGGSLPNVLTIVQNNINDLTIQQINMLDITVENMDNFVQQSVRPEINLQSTMRFVP